MMTVHPPSRTPADPITDAITALTSLARRPSDFAEVACRIFTAVAANQGGVEQLLNTRPGSWEADLVRQIVLGTAGPDAAELLRWRTEPLRIQVDVEAIFDEFGILDLYEADANELAAREAAADDALFNAIATPAEKARIQHIHTTFEGLIGAPTAQDADDDLMREAITLMETISFRAAASTHPLVLAHADAEARATAARKLWIQDRATYKAAYLDTIRQALTDRGLTAEISVEPVDHLASLRDDPFLDELHAHARQATPLPMTDTPPDWTLGTPADALRAAGLTYQNRAANQVPGRVLNLWRIQ